MSDVKLNTFKCPKCGATIYIKRGERNAVCEYCGTSVDIPEDKFNSVIMTILIIAMLIAMVLMMR